MIVSGEQRAAQPQVPVLVRTIPIHHHRAEKSLLFFLEYFSIGYPFEFDRKQISAGFLQEVLRLQSCDFFFFF